MEAKNNIVYSMKIMIKLVEMGIYPVQTIPNPKKPEFNCWVFENTEQFQQGFRKAQGWDENG